MPTDQEVLTIKAAVSCALVLERDRPPWRLDRKQSTRNALKYRRGAGEIIIVNHGGRGWWDPLSEARGDVFGLVQQLEPGCSFGRARRRLRDLVGLQRLHHDTGSGKPCATPQLRWSRARRLVPATAAWRYLEQERGLPAWLLTAAARADAVRAGSYGTAWFAHRDGTAGLTGFEMRGPAFRGFARGGAKSLFRLPGSADGRRLAVAEGAIDALSLAAHERLRADTIYLATTGGLGLLTVACLQESLAFPGRWLAIASDNDPAGSAMAARLGTLAKAAGRTIENARPPLGAKDWNELLQDACGHARARVPSGRGTLGRASAPPSHPSRL